MANRRGGGSMTMKATAIRIKQEPLSSSTTVLATAPAPPPPPPSPPTTTTTIMPAVQIKQERLTSFRSPRDLTLGGALTTARINRNVAPKKVYTPNLNAIRNKNADVTTSRDTTGLGRGRGRGGGGRGRGAGAGAGKDGPGAKNLSKNGGVLVQTSGLFSEGTGEAKLRRSSVFDRNNSGGGGGGADGGNSLRRPTLTRDRKIDPEIERKQIQDVLGNDDGDDDDDDEEDGATKLMAGMKGLANDAFRPIELHQQSSNYAIKNEIKIERTDPSAPASVAAVEYPHSLEDFFNRTGPQLFLLQLPDSLPGHGPDMEPGESAAAEQNNKSDDPSASYCTVRQLEEGLIGKIVRYKSGRTKLVTGDARFDVVLGMEPGLLQEVISANTNAKERSGNLINLGQINAKLSAIPDWEFMFNGSARSGPSS